jgi:hypothetical protein
MISLPARAIRVIGRDPGRAFLLIRMAAWVVLLSTLVRLSSLSRAVSLVSTKPYGPPRDIPTDEQLTSAIDELLEINISVFKPNCWRRAVVLHRYLALRGVATDIVFGVKKNDEGEIAGHAWLEKDGKPFLETESNYAVTYKVSAEPVDSVANSKFHIPNPQA